LTKPHSIRTKYLLVGGILLLVGSMLLSAGCKDRSARPNAATGTRPRKNNDSSFLVDTLSKGLNNLPREVVLDLQPPVPILDDAKSADGQPVLATCGVTPAVPDGPHNYLYVPKGNANFRKLGVRPGDIVRFFIDVDQDSVEHGIKQVNFIELTVRRLDINNPQNALIIEGDLGGPIQFPERIEIWRFSDKRMNEIRQRIARYVKKPKTLIGWEPSPDESALEQLLERANQWLRNLPSEDQEWQPEPLIFELPTELTLKLGGESPFKELLSSYLHAPLRQFDPTEARQLQQAIWLRDISRWAKNEAVSPVEVATELFDWAIRNIQLKSPGKRDYVHQPWQVLMYGHGSAEQRAWVFAELCRQQQLDVVMLATGDQWWLPALLHDGQLHLFDTRLGLPLPGKEPGSVATLAELIADPSLLDKLRLDKLSVGEENKYSTTIADLKEIAAWLVASSLQLTQRAILLEQALEGDDYVALSANTRRVTEGLKKHPHVGKVQLWPFPFESVLAERAMSPTQRLQAAQRFLVFASRPRLWKARVLHFQGTKAIPIEDRNDPLAQPDLGHQQATTLYQNPRIRPSNARLEEVEPSKRVLYQTAKGDASYWLGLLSYDLGKYKVAKNWLAELTLAASPNGPWTAGARYNLARTLEALGDLPAAIKLLESDDSPQRHGNLLRARELKRAESEE